MLSASVSEHLGLATVSDLTTVRVSQNYVLRSNAAGVIVRVAPLNTAAETLAVNTSLITQLSDAGAPVLAALDVQPVALQSGHHYTVWPLAQPANPSPEQIGELLAALHTTPVHNATPVWGGSGHDSGRLEKARQAGVPSHILEFLERKAEHVPEWRAMLAESAKQYPATVHSDAHRGNMVTYNDRLLWIDLDGLSVGPAEIDFGPHLVAARRFSDEPAYWERLIEAYTHKAPALDDDRLKYSEAIKSVTMLTWLASIWGIRPDTREELLHRVDTWAEDARWHAL